MNIEIKKAKQEDLESIQELNHKLFELEYQYFDNTLNVGWTYEKAGEDYFKDIIKNGIVLLAIVDNQIVGYLSGSISKINSESKLDNMFIIENYRKYGIGSKLINEFKSYCLTKGIDNIKVSTYAKNKNAITFYLKNGFEEWDITLKCKL